MTARGRAKRVALAAVSRTILIRAWVVKRDGVSHRPASRGSSKIPGRSPRGACMRWSTGGESMSPRDATHRPGRRATGPVRPKGGGARHHPDAARSRRPLWGRAGYVSVRILELSRPSWPARINTHHTSLYSRSHPECIDPSASDFPSPFPSLSPSSPSCSQASS